MLADRQMNDGLSEIVDSEGGHMKNFLYATAFLFFLEGGEG